MKKNAVSLAIIAACVALIAAIFVAPAQGAPGEKGERQVAQMQPRGPGGPGFGGGPGGPGGEMRGRPGMEHKRGPGGDGLQMLLRPEAQERLGLSEEQVERLKAIRFETEERQIDLEADMKRAHLELQRLMEADKPDRDAVMGQIERVGELETQIKKLHIGNQLDVQELLTDEQVEKIQEFRRGMAERMRERAAGPRERMGRGDRDGDRGGPAPERRRLDRPAPEEAQ